MCPPAGEAPAPVHPAVSVLVPIYNVERYLEQCLESLWRQSFADFEVICINDGSTDDSRSIIQRFLDADVRFSVIDKGNSGYGASMNRGLAAARGEYVAILESDDFFEPNALERLVGVACETGAEVVKGNFWLYWSEPAERRELFRAVGEDEAGRTLLPLDYPPVFFRKPSIWSALYRRDFLERHDIRFLETPGASYQDAGFNFKVWASAKRATLISDALLNYRQDNEASSVNSAAKAFCVCDEYASMEEFLSRVPAVDVPKLKAILDRMRFDSYLWNYDRLGEGLRGHFLEHVSRELGERLAEGTLCLEYYEPGAEADLRLLVADPARFCEVHDRVVGGSGSAMRHYLEVGGAALLAKVVLFRLVGRSKRRTNARGECA